MATISNTENPAMILQSVTPEDIKAFFPINFYLKGETYSKEGRVKDLQVLYKGHHQEKITATICGEKEYTVNIELTGPASKLFLRGVCTCPIHINCKHVVATLLTAMQQPLSSPSTRPALMSPLTKKPNPKLEYWLQDLKDFCQAAPKRMEQTSTEYSLVYILILANRLKNQLKVQLYLAKKLKNNSWGPSKKLSLITPSHQQYLQKKDRELLIKLELANKLAGQITYNSEYILSQEMGEEILHELIATHRCCWVSAENGALTEASAIEAQIEWVVAENGYQTPRLSYQDPSLQYFFVDELWYYAQTTQSIGLVKTTIEKPLLQLLLTAPALPPEYTEEVASLLKNTKVKNLLPTPAVFAKQALTAIKPIPCLRLTLVSIKKPGSYKTYWQPVAAKAAVAFLNFDYQGQKIAWDDPQEVISTLQDKQITQLNRNINAEEAALAELERLGLTLMDDMFEYNILNQDQSNYFLIDNDNCDPLDFTRYGLATLKTKGWHIEIAADYPYQIIDEDIDEWYSAIDSNASYDWFGLELGITVQGEKINLLPVLQDLMHKLDLDKDDFTNAPAFMVQLPDGRYIEIPAERIQTIFNIFIELYDKDSLDEQNKLRLSKLQAIRLQELSAALSTTKLRWFGDDKLRALGKKLTDFKGITPAIPPTEFQGQLRPYQQEGLNWLQFLREYELSGILADDMGLGKTVQALAHLSLEKVQGRMLTPSLVVAPTSLMFNWQMEAARFAPHLSVLVLHGAERKQSFTNLQDYDLILTTYPLLVRDKEVLLKQNFHLLILDEAQFIKNSKNLATQVALQLKAQHRLCLTGTPIENHLGELWSLFHFMMPGLLGDEKKFNRLFRIPIEKFADQDRRLALNKRIAPFLLRRTKDKVVQELPPKIEIIRHVELEGAQRDLYETIRMTMQKRVRDEIARLGLARSHIIILDALLKLRQICCDPRLLKMATPQPKQDNSAKLDLLMSLLPELLEEGRRILLFSQFTEMLELIEKELKYRRMPYVKLTGQTKDRATPVKQFQAGQVPLFLISLKAGGTGLNLTAADVVIHYDPWWNPAVENQATDRAHRIGQDKTVFVYKFIAKETVEEKILEMQKNKQALMDGLFSEQTNSQGKITEQDLEQLFAPF